MYRLKRKLRGFGEKGDALWHEFAPFRRDIHIQDQNPIALSVLEMGTLSSGLRPAILLQHGYAGCAETWHHQLRHLAPDHYVIAPDLRGHGQSAAPLTQYSIPELVSDLEAIISSVNLSTPLIIVGHSFGGSICAEYAVRHPDKVAGLILIATPAKYPLPFAARLAYHLPNGFYQVWWPYRKRYNAEVHVMKRMMANAMQHWDGTDMFTRLTIPTLLINGSQDTYFPRPVFELTEQAIPDAMVTIIPNAKHKMQLHHPDEVNAAVDRFIHQTTKQTTIMGFSEDE